ncbi:MAG TPA: lipid A-modifier LpxR family protein [Myxococcaceae bacterium]|nr:lipid A-modifier LpxR family protein [Myxococcaceae bacterium]
MPALASQPYALELRGGASVLSGQESFRFYYLGDNDSVGPLMNPATGLNYDRWYSCSTLLGLRWTLNPEWLHLPSDSRVLLSTTLGQNIYTPRTAMIASEDELQGDRPYSGWLRGSVGLDVLLPNAPLAFTRGGRPYSHLSLDLNGGTQGPWSFAGWVQFHAHNLGTMATGQSLPTEVGWGVVETKPGLAIDVSAFAETSLASLEAPTPSWMEWSGGHPTLSWMVGTSAYAGSMLLSNALHTTLTAGWTGDPLARDRAFIPWAAYVFIRGEARGVWYNATIDGPLLDGAVVARHAPFRAELAAGGVMRFWRLEGSYSAVYRTNEVASLQRNLQVGQLIWQLSVSYVQ